MARKHQAGIDFTSLRELLPMDVNDTGVGDGILVKQIHTLPHGFPEMGCCYAIVWQKLDGIIKPVVMRGSHQFLTESRDYAFTPNQGYEGRMLEAAGSMDYEVISNMLCVNPRAFLRKHSALLTGISSILFIPRFAGALLELGFSKPDGADLSLRLLRTNHAPAMNQCVRVEEQSGFLRPSADRISTAALRTRSSPPGRSQNNSLWPSLGSKGHPLCCQLPCKYVRKRKGCKDGLRCMRCHLCRFSKCGARHSFNLEREFKSEALATAMCKPGMAAHC